MSSICKKINDNDFKRKYGVKPSVVCPVCGEKTVFQYHKRYSECVLCHSWFNIKTEEIMRDGRNYVDGIQRVPKRKLHCNTTTY